MTSSWLYMLIVVALWVDTQGSGGPKPVQFTHNEKCFKQIEQFIRKPHELHAISYLLLTSRQRLPELQKLLDNHLVSVMSEQVPGCNRTQLAKCMANVIVNRVNEAEKSYKTKLDHLALKNIVMINLDNVGDTPLSVVKKLYGKCVRPLIYF